MKEKGETEESESQTEVKEVEVVLPFAWSWILFPAEPQRRPAAGIHKPASLSRLPRIVWIFPPGSQTFVAAGLGGLLLLPISAARLRQLSSPAHLEQMGKEVIPPIKQMFSSEKLKASATVC